LRMRRFRSALDRRLYAKPIRDALVMDRWTVQALTEPVVTGSDQQTDTKSCVVNQQVGTKFGPLRHCAKDSMSILISSPRSGALHGATFLLVLCIGHGAAATVTRASGHLLASSNPSIPAVLAIVSTAPDCRRTVQRRAPTERLKSGSKAALKAAECGPPTVPVGLVDLATAFSHRPYIKHSEPGNLAGTSPWNGWTLETRYPHDEHPPVSQPFGGRSLAAYSPGGACKDFTGRGDSVHLLDLCLRSAREASADQECAFGRTCARMFAPAATSKSPLEMDIRLNYGLRF
jgi:hypothetical protein